MIAVGKIHDIFAGRGMTEFAYTTGNTDGLAKDARLSRAGTLPASCFVNLVDFDMLYGHRRNPDGYAQALHEFDAWLPELPCKARRGRHASSSPPTTAATPAISSTPTTRASISP